MNPTNSGRRRTWYGVFFWLLFASGIFVHFFAPRLQVADGKFVIPASAGAEQKIIDPEGLVKRDRRIQLISLILTVLGAAGLACLYRNVLLNSGSGTGKPQTRLNPAE